MPTFSRFKIKVMRLLVIFVACLMLYITASSAVRATGASITFSRSLSSSTVQVTLSGKEFGVRKTITISVAFPGDLSNKRFHDWLQPSTYAGETSA